ncbi:outer membrane protein transport protein [Photobacterium sagamiensis]|uniref:OmpP1/FadL family transporter n=1 Tax=Photobacterium sagamiensis TaxID=2910241 RepID=UPI003D1448C5
MKLNNLAVHSLEITKCHLMSRHSLSCYLAGGALLLAPLFAQAGGGIHTMVAVTKYTATAGAGHATDTGATASYNNPAGLGLFQGRELYTGVTVLEDSLHFYDEGSTGPDADARARDIDYSGSGLTAIPSLFYASSINDNLAYGISFAPMSGGEADFGSDWVGSNFVNSADVKIVGLSAAVGHRINDSWSLGASVGVAYMSWEVDSEVPANDAPNSTNSFELEDFQPYWQLGVMYLPTDTTRMGLRYLSGADFELSGDNNMVLDGQEVTTDAGLTGFNMPNLLSFSIDHQLSERLSLLADIKWNEWSRMEENILTVGDTTGVIDRNWRNTWGGAVGVAYQQSEALSLKAGISYDESPVATKDHKVDPPLDRQVRYAFGVGYAPTEKNWSLDLSYQYLDLGDVTVNQSVGPYVVKGSSEAHCHIINLGLGYRF